MFDVPQPKFLKHFDGPHEEERKKRKKKKKKASTFQKKKNKTKGLYVLWVDDNDM